jgi:hypothetical protein
MNNVKTFEELKTMTLKEVIDGKCFLKFSHTGTFKTAYLHEQIIELVKHFGLCEKYFSGCSSSFNMEDAKHFGTNKTPKISNEFRMKNNPNRWGHVYNCALFGTTSYSLMRCEINEINVHRDTNDYYIMVDDLKTCSVFFYNDNGKLVISDYPIYRILERANKRRLSEIKKEKNENIKKFEMKLEMMGLQGFLEIDSLTLLEYCRSNLAKTAQLVSNGYYISANYRREWRENLFDISHNNNKINIKQLTPENLKIILTALQQIGKL